MSFIQLKNNTILQIEPLLTQTQIKQIKNIKKWNQMIVTHTYHFHINNISSILHLYETIVKKINCRNHFQLGLHLFTSTHYLFKKINELQSYHPHAIQARTLMNTVQTKIRTQLTPSESISEYFQDACYRGRFHIAQLLFQLQSIHTYCSMDVDVFKDIFVWGCIHDMLDVAQFIHQIQPTLLDVYVNEVENTFIHACSKGYIEVAQWLYQIKPTLNISAENEYAFRMACINGHLQVAQWLYPIKPTLDISQYDEEAFRMACYNGHLEMAQWLYQIKPTLDISQYDEDAFRSACYNDHLQVAQWMYQIKPTLDISAKNDEAFRDACEYKHIQVALWLQTILPERYIVDFYTEYDFEYSINQPVKIEQIINVNTLDTCPICYENPCAIQTNCNHSFCTNCITKWINTDHSQCPCCREDISDAVFYQLQLV
jgi:hypothetical protein